jgi:parallel beta-helix repeat protein
MIVSERYLTMTLSRLALAIVIVLSARLSLTGRAAQGQPTIPAAANRPGLSAALSASPPYRCSTNRYVDGTNGNDANPGTQAQPWKTIQNADNWGNNVPTAGECVNVLPGIYALSKTLILHRGGDSNSLAGFVVYRSTVPQAAHLIAATGITAAANGDLIQLWAPYIIVDGFDIDGDNALTSGHGIDGCVGGGAASNVAHHFVAINNVVHDMGGAGLNSCTADYIVWRNNVIYNTSSTNRYQVSGINIWQPKAVAAGSYTTTAWDNAPFGIEISYNITHDNKEGPSIAAPHTDGNGIIIDSTVGGACPTCDTPYPGNILVLGNVAYNNGGSGISVYLSKNVTIANNTVYNNYLDPLNPGTARGELSQGGSQNVTWVNNIAIAVPGSGVLSNNKPAVTWSVGASHVSGTWKRNITYGADAASDANSNPGASTNMPGVNPQLTNPAGGNFIPRSGSPAIGTGLPRDYLPARTPNIGAY